jgi:hypothetical protein
MKLIDIIEISLNSVAEYPPGSMGEAFENLQNTVEALGKNLVEVFGDKDIVEKMKRIAEYEKNRRIE